MSLSARKSLLIFFVALLGIIVWLFSLSPEYWTSASALWVLRSAVASAFLVLATGPLRRFSVGYLTPSFLLGLVAILLFVWAPAVFAAALDWLPETITIQRVPIGFLLSYVGSKAEIRTIGFSALLAAATAIATLTPHHGGTVQVDRPVPSYSLGPLSAGLLVVTLALFLGRTLYHFHGSGGLSLTGGFSQHVADAMWPLLSAALVTSAYLTIENHRWGVTTWAAGACLSLLVMLGSYSLKVGMSAAAISLSFYAITQRVALWRSAIFAVPALIVAGVLIIAVNNLRAHSGITEAWHAVKWSSDLISKVAIRQGWTGYCLAVIIERHGAETAQSSPLRYFAGVVPRVIWPEKPNLSQGTFYATEYCGVRVADIDPGAPHSAAITLLGEPIIHGGMKGLVAVELWLTLLLGVLTAILIRAGPAGRIFIIALLPWLIDFEQSLSFYIANLTKSAIYMAPWILIVRHFTRVTSRERAVI